MATTIYFSQNYGPFNSSLRAWDPTVTSWDANIDAAEQVVPLGGEGDLTVTGPIMVARNAEPGGLDRIYFTGNGAGNPSDAELRNTYTQLWTSDGTEGGTLSLTPYWAQYDMIELGAWANNSFYFAGSNAAAGTSYDIRNVELYIAPRTRLTDGIVNNEWGFDEEINTTGAGGWNSSSPHDFIQGKGEFYFWANNGTGDRLFWHNGGSAPVLLTDTNREGGFDPSYAVLDASPRSLSGEVTDGQSNTLFFSDSGTLYQANGLNVDAVTINTYGPRPIEQGGGYSGVLWSVSLVGNHGGNGVMFSGYRSNTTGGLQGTLEQDGLWRYTPGQGTTLVEENFVVTGSGLGIATDGTSNTLLFIGYDEDDFGPNEVRVSGLWESNGSFPNEITGTRGLDFGGQLRGGALLDTVFFLAKRDGDEDPGLWQTTADGAAYVTHFGDADQWDEIKGFTAIDNWMYFFVAREETSGSGGSGYNVWDLWRINAGSAPQLIAKSVNPNAGVVGADTKPLFNVINGTTGNDGLAILTGTAGRDHIRGLAGDDTIQGQAGGDKIEGGDGSDWVVYDASPEGVTVNLKFRDARGGHAGGDSWTSIENVRGSAQNDNLSGTDAANTLQGMAGANVLVGFGGNDELDAGTDATTVANKVDYLYGGAGHDTFIARDFFDQAIERNFNYQTNQWVDNGGTDTVRAMSSYNLTHEQAIERLTAFDLASTVAINLRGNNLANTITGNAGNNYLEGGTGTDQLRGRGGNDTYELFDIADTVDESSTAGGSGKDLIIIWGVDFSLAPSEKVRGPIEDLTLVGHSGMHGLDGTGTNGVNTITGSSGNNSLFGLGGNDTLYGGAGSGADWLDGGADSDRMEGGDGSDIYVVAQGGDVVKELAAQGLDEVRASVSRTLEANVEWLTLTGAGGINGTGNGGINRIAGNDAINTLRGLDGADTLIGGKGNDRLDGGALGDRMEGGVDNDRYVVDHSLDNVVEGSVAIDGRLSGNDTVEAWITETLQANVENLELKGVAVINGTGNGAGNIILGNDQANTLSGLGGEDALSGRMGIDTLLGGERRDTLDGGEGRDSLSGGAGDDVFRFRLRGEADGDVLRDFRNVTGDNDVIHIRAAGFGAGLTATNVAVTTAQFESEASDNRAEGEFTRFVFNRANGQLWFDDNGNDIGGLTLLADLENGTLLGRTDLILV